MELAHVPEGNLDTLPTLKGFGPQKLKAKWETIPLTAGELIQLLSQHPADTPVVCGGDEFGYNIQIEIGSADLNAATSHWSGPHLARGAGHGQVVLTVRPRHDKPSSSY